MGEILRTLLDHVPVVGRLARRGKKKFTNSAEYWERHYGRKRDSGPGSYGRLAEFKARVLNEFVRTHDVDSVVEFGCGDGNQLSLADYRSYTGLDVSPTAIEICRQNFKDDPTKVFHLLAAGRDTGRADPIRADLALSLDVLFHLVEDDVYRQYMRDLFAAARRFVIIYASDFEREPEAPHMKYRKFTGFVEAEFKDWTLIETIKNEFPFETFGPIEGSISDFFIYQRSEA